MLGIVHTHSRCENGHTDVADVLLQHGAQLVSVRDSSHTLTYACKNGHTDVADVLLQHGAQLVSVRDSSHTLTYTCENGHTDVADVLLQHGAQLVSVRDSSHTRTPARTGTPTWRTCYCSTEPSCVRDSSHTLTYACENGHTDVADVLLQHGAQLVSIKVNLH